MWVQAVGLVLASAGFNAVMCGMSVNSFLSSTIEVTAEQHVVTTGPDARVRHPMYAGAMLLTWDTLLALGSWSRLICVALLTGSTGIRLLGEEKAQEADLPGSRAFEQQPRLRLVPRLC